MSECVTVNATVLLLNLCNKRCTSCFLGQEKGPNREAVEEGSQGLRPDKSGLAPGYPRSHLRCFVLVAAKAALRNLWTVFMIQAELFWRDALECQSS